MPILNYTTKIDSYKTVTEIQKILAMHGASKIVIDNDNAGNPIFITFCINWNGIQTAFSLPCNFTGVLGAMQENKKVPRSFCTKEQAMRVGWRILKDWIESQMAIIEAQMGTLQEVFLPYAVTRNGDTLYNHIEAHRDNFLGPAK